MKVLSTQTAMEKSTFQSALMNLLNLIGELLGEQQNVEIDIGEFGKFQAMNRLLMYAPVNRARPSGQ